MSDRDILYDRLKKNIRSLHGLNNDMAMVELAIHQKSMEALKENKIEELSNYLNNHIKMFKQNKDKFDKEISAINDKYQLEIDKFMTAYEDFYVQVFKLMSDAGNEQNYTIANLLETKNSLLDGDNSVQDEERLNQELLADAEKKLNYSVIIDECRARLKWCSEKAQNDFEQLFKISDLSLEEYGKSIVSKIRSIFGNIFFGKNNCKKFFYDFNAGYLKELKLNNKKNIINLFAVLTAVQRQIKLTNIQISKAYNEKVKM